jgi:ribose/xylose/arabinose/galactoside ABC-type transport system permease subunit
MGRNTLVTKIPSIIRVRETGVCIALVIIFIFFTILSPYFFNLNNLVNILRQVSLLGIIAMGMTMVIVCGEIDLSVGSVYGASAILCGVMLTNGMSLWIALVISLLCGALFGLLNGFLVTYGRIPAMIVTLGMMNIARGFALIVSNGRVVNLSARTVADPHLDAFLFMGQGKIGIIPVMSVFFLGITLLAFVIFSRTLLGFRMKAVGGSSTAARASGINDRIVKIAAFTIVGIFSALAGLLNIAFLGNVQGTTGQGMEMNSIAAVIIGGTTLKGGEGTVVGTLIGYSSWASSITASSSWVFPRSGR